MTPRYKERISLKAPVIFTGGSQVGEGQVLDVTSTGCLIESPLSIHKAQAMQLKMFLPGIPSPFLVALSIVRWTKGSRFGVEFLKMEESQRQILNRFMAQHRSQLAAGLRPRKAFSEQGGQNWHLETYSLTKAR